MGLRLQRRNSGRQAQLPVHRTLVTRLHRDEKNQPSSGRKWNRRHWQARHHPAGVRMSLSLPRKSSAQRLAVAPSPPFVFGFLVLGLACCTRPFSSCPEPSYCLLHSLASYCGASSCRTRALGVWASVVLAPGSSVWAQYLWSMGLVVPGHVESFQFSSVQLLSCVRLFATP